jgi:hypothetical protein
MYRRQRPALLLFIGIAFMPALMPRRPAHSAAPIVGQVTDASGPVAGARVRWQGQATFAVSAADGTFRLPAHRGEVRRVTASKSGYCIASVVPGRSPVELRLELLPARDNEAYDWQSPHRDAHRPGSCGNCHDEIHGEWAASAHARAARNPRLLQLLADPDGKSPPGWDLSREHPFGVAVCAECHAPTLADGDPPRARGVAAEGVHCDYCHKIADAPIDKDKLGVRFGLNGLVLLRPGHGEQLSFGPLDDAVRAGESFAQLPLYRESRACASCHEGTVFGVPVYTTYSEWLESPAAVQGVQCQGCHMTPTGRLTNIAPGHGGIERDPRTLASHRFAGSEADMLRRCLSLDVHCRKHRDGVRVEVTVRADQVGHRVPTGFIDRHLLLVVQGLDRNGAAVPLLAGPRLPRAAGQHANRPGWLYGKLRPDEKDGTPLPFWIGGADVHDTRLRPRQPDVRTFVFGGQPDRVELRLWYRRFWQMLAEARGWGDNDVLVEERTVKP